MKIKVLVGALIFLIIINLATIGSYVYIQMRHHHAPYGERFQPPFAGPPLRGMEMGLDRRQRHELMRLLEELGDSTETLRGQVGNIEKEIFDLLQQEPVPTVQIEERMQQIADLRLQMSRRALAMFVKSKQFLTPEQQRHFYRMLINARPGMRGRPHSFGKGPQPPEVPEPGDN